MIRSAWFQSRRYFSLVLICALLGACATTQKSSTGSGDQPAAPISDAQQTAGSKPGDKPVSPSAATAGAPSSSDTAAVAAAAGTDGGNAATKPRSSESGVTITDSEEEAQLKRQLAEQDAQINRLRTDQQVEAAKQEAEAAKAQEQQAVAAAGANDQQPASSAAASAGQSKSQEEAAAVFPANAAEPGGAESGKSAAPSTLERSVYFDYNQAAVPDKYDSMLVANGAYLKAHPDVKAEVQGNCDERGSREYNLALGARRAQAVKRALELAGANGGNISAISYGAEKPVALGKDEASYSKNRRADIVY